MALIHGLGTWSAVFRRKIGRGIGVASVALLIAVPSSYSSTGVLEDFDSDRASFEVSCEGVTFTLRRLAFPVLPGQEVVIEALDPVTGRRSQADFSLEAASGTRSPMERGRIRWTAPREPGFHEVVVRRHEPVDSVSILFMILVPLDRMENEQLEGYRIGEYPKVPLRGLATYRKPRGLIRVRSEDVDLEVSPHFRLGQFLCKQEGDFPKFILLKPELLQKLERLLSLVNDEGIAAPTLHVMSGYRTPYYNKAIGNVRYSRHVYGDAADVFVDFSPEDGYMDDIDGSGKVDRGDVDHLAAIAERVTRKGLLSRLVGGLGIYSANERRGPFLHVDTRGSKARW